MKTKKICSATASWPLRGLAILLLFFSFTAGSVHAQKSPADLAKYTPAWIKDGFVDGGATHEPWIFQVRRGGEGFNQWQRDAYDNQMSEEYIKSLSEAGITV